MRQYFVNMGFWGRGLSYIFILAAMLLISAAAGNASAYLIFGPGALDGSSVPALRYLQAVLSAGLFMAPAAVMCLVFREGSPRQRLGLGHVPRLGQVLLCVAIIVAAQPMAGYLEELNLGMSLPECMAPLESWMRARQDSADELSRRLIESPSWGVLAANILVMAALPAVGEELAFRMAVQEAIISDTTRMPRYWAAALAAAIFSAAHLQFFGFAPRLVMGFVLGLMLIETRGIICSMAAHFANNVLVLAWAFAKARAAGIDIPGHPGSPAAAAASALAVAGLLALLRRSEKKVEK